MLDRFRHSGSRPDNPQEANVDEDRIKVTEIAELMHARGQENLAYLLLTVEPDLTAVEAVEKAELVQQQLDGDCSRVSAALRIVNRNRTINTEDTVS